MLSPNLVVCGHEPLQDNKGAAEHHVFHDNDAEPLQLIRTDDGLMLIESGPMSTLPVLQRELEALEVAPP